MAYYLYYNKNTNLFVDIRESNDSDQFNYITIKRIDKNEILKQLSLGKVVKVKNGKFSFEINLAKKREEIVEEKHKLLNELSDFRDPIYQEFLGLTEEQKTQINDYYLQILNLTTNFDDCENQDDFKYIITDDSCEDENTEETVYLKKPKFIKE